MCLMRIPNYFFLAFALFFMNLSSGNTQAIPVPEKDNGGMGYFSLGYHMMNTGNLNDLLQVYDYPDLPGEMISIGGGGHGFVGEWVVGGHGHSFMNRPQSNETYDLSISGGYGFVDVGYVVNTRPGWDLYPLLGVGFGGFMLDISEDQPAIFNELLEEPETSMQVGKGGFLLDLSLNATYLFDFTENYFTRNGLVLGLQVGYVLDPFENQWKINGNDVTNGPDMDMGGPYLRLKIGGGGFNYPEEPE